MGSLISEKWEYSSGDLRYDCKKIKQKKELRKELFHSKKIKSTMS